MNKGNELFDTLLEKLEKFLRTETVVGESFQVGSITLVPIISVSFGVGGGHGSGKDSKGNDGTGGGTGVGCKITPNAVLVIKNDELSVVSLTGKGSLERIVEMVPEIISKVDCSKNKETPESGDEG